MLFLLHIAASFCDVLGLTLEFHECQPQLIGGLEPWNFIYPYIGNVIIPTDELIFFKGIETTNQLKMGW
jgi:hypothetical protein